MESEATNQQGLKEWKITRLDQCARIIGGSTPKTSVKEYWNGDICWTTPKDLSDLVTPYLEETPRRITKVGLDSCGAEILPEGSVLFSSRAPIGHVAINIVPMATNQGFKSFVPSPEKLDAKFLYYWLRKNRDYFRPLAKVHFLNGFLIVLASHSATFARGLLTVLAMVRLSRRCRKQLCHKSKFFCLRSLNKNESPQFWIRQKNLGGCVGRRWRN